MESKVLEIRDRATYIPVIATKMSPENDIENYYLRHSGYAFDPALILVTTLNHPQSSYDPFKWSGGGGRTLFEAHLYIQDHFDELKTGDVIDVEYILKETETPKVPQRYTDFDYLKNTIKVI